MWHKTRRGRISPRERKALNNANLSFIAAASPRPDAADNLQKLLVPIPPKRQYLRRPVDGSPAHPLEKDILADALQALRNDDRVWIVDRQQSGVFHDGDRVIRVGRKGHLDIKGMLKGGRYFELEAKRPGQKPDENQLQRIEHVRRGGGIAGYFTSAAEALALLP